MTEFCGGNRAKTANSRRGYVPATTMDGRRIELPCNTDVTVSSQVLKTDVYIVVLENVSYRIRDCYLNLIERKSKKPDPNCW